MATSLAIAHPRRFARSAELVVDWVLLVLAVANLALVMFDLSYLDARPFLLRHAPTLVAIYDPVKGIAPERHTQAYLDDAEVAFATLGAHPGTSRAARVLSRMRQDSLALYAEQPFAEADLQGFFEQLKHRLEHHMRVSESKAAFLAFWSAANLSGPHLDAEHAFFERELRPPLAANFYRRIADSGRPYDDFWRLDLWFLPLFALDFLIRGLAGIRSDRYPSWKGYLYARWADLGYFVPAGQALPLGRLAVIPLLRAISVGQRMQRLGLVNPMAVSEPYLHNLSDLVSDLVTVKLLSNLEREVTGLDLARMVAEIPIDQVLAVLQEHAEALVLRILPAIAPELEAMLVDGIRRSLPPSLPFATGIGERMVPELVAKTLARAEQALCEGLVDPAQRDRVARMVAKVKDQLVAELTEHRTEAQLKGMVLEVLEKQKRDLLTR